MSWIEKVFRIGFLVAPLVLLLLPADFFDEGPVVCPSRLFLGVECPGCGLTRATQHLVHGHWQTAMDYNPLVLVTTPLLLYLWGLNALHLFKNQQRLKKTLTRK